MSVRWANGRSHLQEPPNVPGTYTGNLSFRMMGATFTTSKATKAVVQPKERPGTTGRSLGPPPTRGM